MVELRGDIGHQEGSIAGREQKHPIAPEIIKREQEAWRKVLGTEVEIKPLPEYVTPELIKNLKELGMELRYIPKLNLGTLDELKTMGEEEFLKKLERRYPNWRRYEDLSDTEKNDHSINRNLEEWYWEQVKDEKVDFPQAEGLWMAVETMPKPPYGEKYKPSPVRKWDRFGVSWRNATRDIEIWSSYLLTKAGLPESSEVRLPEALEYNILANREGWGKTDTYEWTNTKHNMGGDEGAIDSLIVGRSDFGGAACVDSRFIDDGGSPYNNIGFRVAVVLGS